MQDVTDLAFMRVIATYGAPDYFFTEFFRVHGQSRPERHILRSIDENQTGRPIYAQLIGEDIPHMVRTAEELLRHPIAGIDLNLGCPAPKVYKKNVGGGLLRDPARVDEILAALRETVSRNNGEPALRRLAVAGGADPGTPDPDFAEADVAPQFTVKMRIGFDSTEPFETIIESVNRHHADLLTVHGRTVKEMYRSEVHYDFIARAVQLARCPVLANGNVTSAPRAQEILAETRAAGVMIGRHAIRNPWIFRQCREHFSGQPLFRPTLGDVRTYIQHLYRETGEGFVHVEAASRRFESPSAAERAHVNKMKKYLNFVGQSVDPEGRFLQAMRRTQSEAELFAVCDEHLTANASTPFALEPYPGVVARPNCETPVSECADVVA
jgi:tRNA-dihydrouridine synthase